MKKIIALLIAGAPALAFAQRITDIDSLSNKAVNIGNLVVGLAISIAVLWIIVSVVRYLIIGAADPEKRKLAGWSILYGVVGLFVILSIWGLVAILRNSFKTQDQMPTDINRTTQLPRPGSVPNY